MGSIPLWGSETFQNKDMARQSFTYTRQIFHSMQEPMYNSMSKLFYEDIFYHRSFFNLFRETREELGTKYRTINVSCRKFQQITSRDILQVVRYIISLVH